MADKNIDYILIARIDGQQVFHEHYPDTFEVQEVGLSDAEDTVSMYLDAKDLEPEELSYIHSYKAKKLRKKMLGETNE